MTIIQTPRDNQTAQCDVGRGDFHVPQDFRNVSPSLRLHIPLLRAGHGETGNQVAPYRSFLFTSNLTVHHQEKHQVHSLPR